MPGHSSRQRILAGSASTTASRASAGDVGDEVLDERREVGLVPLLGVGGHELLLLGVDGDDDLAQAPMQAP